MKAFWNFIKWLCHWPDGYVRVCARCGFIHHNDEETTCCMCKGNTILVTESRGQKWHDDLRINHRIVAALEG